MKPGVLALLLALGLSGCLPAGFWSTLDQTPPRQTADLREPGDNDAAFDLLQAAPTPPNAQHAGWIATLNVLLTRAVSQQETEHFLEAGRTYRRVLLTLEEQGIAAELAMSRKQILHLLERCADRLLIRGLAAYRRGNLAQALAIWSDIGSFHPNHASSQRAIHTTRTQLHNLESSPSG